ncbi:hypothetical protein JCM10908_005775 [Rhodotorula pacifica]|uniref:uncharacterized protein n=1 Tax=Rhodotorula pacifica TaxID=1495444 RepID=UPI003177C691
MECFVCSERLEGDDDFIRFHLNSCLDRQGSSQGGSVTSASKTKESQLDRMPNGDKSLSEYYKRIPAAVEDEHDRLLALALAEDGLSTGDHASPSSTDGDRATPAQSACPCCAVSWQTLGLADAAQLSPLDGTVAEQKAAHVEACLAARELDAEEAVSNRAGSESGRDGLTSHGRAEDEYEKQGRRMVASGASKARSQNTGGDAAHEQAVNSTPGLIHLLAHALEASHASPHGRTSEAYLANELVEHVSTRLKDYGWGCGYKNAQMIYSSFRHVPQLREVLLAVTKSGPEKTKPRRETDKGKRKEEEELPIPPIRWWQETIEAAWREGCDPMGAAHFKHRLVNSRRWIGTTEIFTALSYTGIQTLIVDFPKSKGTSGTNQKLVNFIVDYFRTPNFLGTAPPPPSSSSTRATSSSSSTRATSAPKNAFDLLASSGGTAVHRTDKQPLYLQHQGHSRTIVGVEIGKRSRLVQEGDAAGGGGLVKNRIRNMAAGTKGRKGSAAAEAGGEAEAEEVWLLLFDPGKPIPQDLKKAAGALLASRQARQPSPSDSSTPSSSREDSPPASKKLRPSPPVETRPRKGFGTNSGSTPSSVPMPVPMPKYGEVLKLFRVNMRELKKKDDYQVLFINPDVAPLSAEQKVAKKTPTSIVIGAD